MRAVPLLLLVAFSGVVSQEIAAGFEQCNRECRFHFGFYDRNVTGVRVGVNGHKDRFGHHCLCYKDGIELPDKIQRVTTKAWDDAGSALTPSALNPTSVLLYCVLTRLTFPIRRVLVWAWRERY